MSDSTYTGGKPIGWLHGEIKSPPFSKSARREAGFLLRCLQDGETLKMPQSRPMPTIGRHCHELRISDETTTWRIVYRIDPHAIIIIGVFDKKTRKTPKSVIQICRNRLRRHDNG